MTINEQDQLEFAAFVGIDWADRQHAWALCEVGSSITEQGQMAHTPEAVDQWAVKLERRFKGRPVAVALEQSRGALVFMLSKYAHLVLFPIHSSSAANYRKSFRPSGAKDDPSDASLLLDLILRHGEKLRPLQPDTPETRTLQFLVQERRKLVKERSRYSNRLTAHLRRSSVTFSSGGPHWRSSSGKAGPPFVAFSVATTAAAMRRSKLAWQRCVEQFPPHTMSPW